MVIKFEAVKNVVSKGFKPVIADGSKCLATGIAYGMMVGAGLEGYKVGKKIVYECAKGVSKAIKNLKAKKATKPETTTSEQPKTNEPEQPAQEG